MNTLYGFAAYHFGNIINKNAFSVQSDIFGDLGYSFNINTILALEPFLRLGYHSWLRMVKPMFLPESGFYGVNDQENYRNGYYAAGAYSVPFRQVIPFLFAH